MRNLKHRAAHALGQRFRLDFSRGALGALMALTLSCSGSDSPGVRYADKKRDSNAALSRSEGSSAVESLSSKKKDAPASSPLTLGVFKLSKDAIVDGDTIKVDGLDASLRLLAIDTEETYKSRRDRAEWDAYASGTDIFHATPGKIIKAASPLGEEAKDWAKHFFDGIEDVRLERDQLKAIKGSYGRYLTYVFAQKDGEWVFYNLEAVRAGMTPYFTKYGYSQRFHDQFVEAQAEAQKAQRGIWAPNCECYPDYPARLVWWTKRADFIQRFRDEAKERDDMVELSDWDSSLRIAKAEGKNLTILGTVKTVDTKSKGVSKVLLSRKRGDNFPLIFFNPEVLNESGLRDSRSEFIRAQGKIRTYTNKYTQRSTLQIIVNNASQIERSLPGFVPGETGASL